MTSYACFLVSGKVQGVCFRAATRDVAVRLGLTGHARNLADGDVEVLAVGAAGAIDQLAEWLQHGPPLARTRAMVRHATETPAKPATGFSLE